MIKNNYKHMCKYFKLMNKFKYFFLVLLCVTTFACSVDTKIQPSQQALVDIENEKLIIKNYKEYEVDESQITLSKIKLDKLFDNPWAIEFIDDNLIVVTEKNGKLSLVDLLNQRVFDIKHKIPTIQYGQGGLLDVLKFEDYLYLSYTITNKDKKYTTAIGRGLFVYPYKELKNFEQIFTAKPFYKDGKHFGSRMLIKDKFLFASIGERGQGSVAQELDSHAGSIIRINLDGSLTENIYKNNLNALPEIFQIGVRNPQGMTLSPYGEIFISNHGAKGGDFIGIVDEGKNYGWDKIGWGGTNYTGFKIGDGEAFLEDFDNKTISEGSDTDSLKMLFSTDDFQYDIQDGQIYYTLPDGSVIGGNKLPKYFNKNSDGANKLITLNETAYKQGRQWDKPTEDHYRRQVKNIVREIPSGIQALHREP